MLITPDRVANSIRLQRSQYQGSFLLVEGKKDKVFYKRLIDKNECRIQVPFQKDNKNNVIKVIYILSEPENLFAGVLAILDADFSLIENDTPKNPNILLTDSHDLETMLIDSPGFDKLINELVTEKKLDGFIDKRGQDIRNALIDMGKYLGYLRWISQRNDYRLNFNELKFKKMINIKDFTVVAFDKIITIVKNNTVSKSSSERKNEKYRIDEKSIEYEAKKLIASNGDLWQICCGHDLICILSIGLRRFLGNYDVKEVDPETIERELRLAYESKYFEETTLYESIVKWEKINSPFKILI